MLETRAIIMRLEGPYAVVKANRTNGCELCQGKGCGASKLSQLFCNTPRQLKVNNSINACIGDEVIIAVAEGVVLRGIGLVYILPLLLLVMGMMLGSMGAESAGQRDAYAAIGSGLGVLSGFGIARLMVLRQARSRFQPYMARQWVKE